MAISKIGSKSIATGAVSSDVIADDNITSDKIGPNIEFTGSYIKVPVGTTAERPGSPEVGHLRFNTTFGRLEQYVTDGWTAIDTPPTVTTLAYSGGVLAADPAGGETVTITGTNFQSGATVTFGGTSAASVTVNSSTSITATTPAKTAGDYDVKVTNSNGLSATLQNGIAFNGVPSFSTAAGKIGDSLAPNTTISTITIVASEPDSGTLSYSITSGAVPSGLTFDSDGTIVGTTPDGGVADTTYNFTVTATDDENQTNSRAFNLVVLRNIYTYSIPQSLMFNNDDSQYLTWTPTSEGNRTTWTISCWIKRSTVLSDNAHTIFSTGPDNTNDTMAYFGPGGETQSFDFIAARDSSTFRARITSHSSAGGTAVFTDPSAWYHFVFVYDSTNATSSERVRLYINGVRQTSSTGFVITEPAQNTQSLWNSVRVHYIGKMRDNSTNYNDGYLTEFHHIDGTALTPTSFAESYNGVWIPKDYTGSYGTNGFHLPMTNDTSVEAFNTVTWYGTGQQIDINGFGFKPDLVWGKKRAGSTDSHVLVDAVRGPTKEVYADQTSSGATNTNGVSAFTDDGFSLVGSGSGSGVWNGNVGHTYVAWGWKAGDTTVSNSEGTITTNVRANPTTGFSIVGNTNTTYFGGNYGHGLGAEPDFVLWRDLSSSNDWYVYHSALGNTKYLHLNTTDAQKTWPNGEVWLSTDTIFGYSEAPLDRRGIIYLWTEKAGYSKFGSYTGGTASNAITLGFKPSLIIVKNTTNAYGWWMVDTTRDVDGTLEEFLFANASDAEGTSGSNRISVQSDGFTLLDTGNPTNASGATYIYAAFADTRDSAFWRDESGNNNDWQPVNTGAYRITTDTPTE